MNTHQPHVSIGLPVFNGENFLEETLDSILAQTFTDFELIISDNASTDRTQEICQAYAAKDERIRYVRNETNLGAARNYNNVFELSSGEYFKWNGHDDPLEPTFLDRCVEVLHEDSSIVLCYTKIQAINEFGKPKTVSIFYSGSFKTKPKLSSPKAYERFFHSVVAHHPQGAIFGLIRRHTLEQTPRIGSYKSSDLPLLGELALQGRFYQVPESLMYRRFHPQQGRIKYNSRRLREIWFDPGRAKKWTFPQIRLLWEHLKAIKRAAPNRKEFFLCYFFMGLWAFKHIFFIAPLKLLLTKPYNYLKSVDKQKRITGLLTKKIEL